MRLTNGVARMAYGQPRDVSAAHTGRQETAL